MTDSHTDTHGCWSAARADACDSDLRGIVAEIAEECIGQGLVHWVSADAPSPQKRAVLETALVERPPLDRICVARVIAAPQSGPGPPKRQAQADLITVQRVNVPSSERRGVRPQRTLLSIGW
jgi:hypothetical protein